MLEIYSKSSSGSEKLPRAVLNVSRSPTKAVEPSYLTEISPGLESNTHIYTTSNGYHHTLATNATKYSLI